MREKTLNKIYNFCLDSRSFGILLLVLFALLFGGTLFLAFFDLVWGTEIISQSTGRFLLTGAFMCFFSGVPILVISAIILYIIDFFREKNFEEKF